MRKIFVLFILMANTIYAQYGGGTGTEIDPYQLASAEHLLLLSTNVNSGTSYAGTFFIVMNDISLSVYTNWSPIGVKIDSYNLYPFCGVFDGNNKVITGLQITGNNNYRGLFGYVTGGAEIKNLTIENCSITCGGWAGALIGYVTLQEAGVSVSINNCHVSGTVSSNGNYVGGLIGAISVTASATSTVYVTQCSSLDSVATSGTSATVGGLIGWCGGSKKFPEIKYCFSAGSVLSTQSGTSSGGFIGYTNGVNISNCYSRTKITASSSGNIGGFIGADNSATGYYTNCYSVGLINTSGGSGFLGAVLYSAPTTTTCFWDKETTTKLSSVLGTGRSTTNMKATLNYSSWSNTIWNMQDTFNNGYPYLRWQNPTGTPLPTFAWTGSGTEGDPYTIYTKNDLASLSLSVYDGNTYSGVYFKLMNDIDLSNFTNWSPIGTYNPQPNNPFLGSFDGNNKKITGLKINETSKFRGFFGIVSSGAIIKNLSIDNCNIYGGAGTGGVTGAVLHNDPSSRITVTHCNVSGTVSSNNDYVGGLVGYLYNIVNGADSSFSVFIEDCSVNATVSTVYSNGIVGGLIGYCNSTVSIQSAYIFDCFTAGSVSNTNGSSQVGGLIGYSSNSYVSRCYSSANIGAGSNSSAGGLIGYADAGTTVNTCYSTGAISGTGANVQGCIGAYITSSSNVSDSYWDTQSSGKSISSGGSGVTGKTTSEMKTQSTYSNWDFINKWEIIGTNYPVLKTQAGPVFLSNLGTGLTTSNGQHIGFYANISGVSLQFETINSAPSNIPSGAKTIEKYWEISDITGGAIKLRLYFATSAIASFSGEPKIFHYNGTTWEELLTGSMVDEGEFSYVETVNYYGSFSPVTVADANNPLPVEIKALSAFVKGRYIFLNWKTATEINVNGFEVERTVKTLRAMSTWERIGFVKGNGNSNSMKEYSFTDNNLLSGSYVYRLKMIDNNGSFKYSDEIKVNIDRPAVTDLKQNYPNSFNPSTKIEYRLANPSRITLELFSLTGEYVGKLLEKESDGGYYVYYFDANRINGGIASGVYFYRMTATDIVTNQTKSFTKKMMFLK